MNVCISHEHWNTNVLIFSWRSLTILLLIPISHFCQKQLPRYFILTFVFPQTPGPHWLLILSSMSAKALVPLFSLFHLPYLRLLPYHVLTVSHKQWMSTARCISQPIPGGLVWEDNPSLIFYFLLDCMLVFVYAGFCESVYGYACVCFCLCKWHVLAPAPLLFATPCPSTLISQLCVKQSSLHKVDSNPHFHLFMAFTGIWKWPSNQMIFSVNSGRKITLKLDNILNKDKCIIWICSHPM